MKCVLFFFVFFSKCYSLWLRVFIFLSIWRRKGKKKKIDPPLFQEFFFFFVNMTSHNHRISLSLSLFVSDFIARNFNLICHHQSQRNGPKKNKTTKFRPSRPIKMPVSRCLFLSPPPFSLFHQFLCLVSAPMCCVSKERNKKKKKKIVILLNCWCFCKYKENKLLPIVLLIIFYKLHMIWIWRRIKTNFSTRVMAILSYLGVWSESDFNFLQNSPWMRINKNCMYNLKSEGTSRRNDGRSFKAIFVHCASEKKKIKLKKYIQDL